MVVMMTIFTASRLDSHVKEAKYLCSRKSENLTTFDAKQNVDNPFATDSNEKERCGDICAGQ